MALDDSHEKICADIYERLLAIVPGLLRIHSHAKSDIPGMMSLNLDILERSPEKLIFALSHYYENVSGDMMPDPDVLVAAYPSRRVAEALTYQDTSTFTVLRTETGILADEVERRSLNAFLHTWLGNLIEQGHEIEVPATALLQPFDQGECES